MPVPGAHVPPPDPFVHVRRHRLLSLGGGRRGRLWSRLPGRHPI